MRRCPDHVWATATALITSIPGQLIASTLIKYVLYVYLSTSNYNVPRFIIPSILPRHSPDFMSSLPTSPNFQSIFDHALRDYATQTGIDLATYPFTQTLRNCVDESSVIELLQDKAKQFQAYRDGSCKLINILKPVVKVLHTLSGILVPAASLVSPENHLVLSDHSFTLKLPGAISTNECNPRGSRCSPHRWYLYVIYSILLTSSYFRLPPGSVQVTTRWSTSSNVS